MTKDYYDILGVSKNASKKEIKKAYKKLAKQYHPDLSDDEGSEEKFKEISEAASVLTDEEERAKYDRSGHNAYTEGQKTGFGGQSGFSGFDFSDFSGDSFNIDDIFDMFMGGGGGRRRQRRGDDKRYDITLDFEEAALGVDKEITFRRKVHCKECDGQGGHNPTSCTTCNGRGVVQQVQRTALGAMQTQRRCPDCGGKGKTYEEKCSACRGAGITSEKETVDFHIPAGVDNGTRMRLRGKGDAARDTPPGDLYVFISVNPHDFYQRDGRTIKVEIPISYTQAVFGDKIDVPTLHGDVELKIPKGTQSNTTFRLSGKGIKTRRAKGDQQVTVRVDVPKSLSSEQKDILRTYQETIGEEPQKGFFERIFG